LWPSITDAQPVAVELCNKNKVAGRVFLAFSKQIIEPEKAQAVERKKVRV
jgi:hypothetical protein